jgi:hypothetical protein
MMMPIPKIDMTEFFRSLGHALIAVQSLDYSLSHYYALWLHTNRDEALSLLDNSLDQTLRTLIKWLKIEGIMPPYLELDIGTFKDNRNWFVHRLYAENWDDLFDSSRAASLLEKINSVRLEAKRLAKEFAHLNEQWCLAHGATPKELEDMLELTLDNLGRPQQGVAGYPPQGVGSPER